MPSPPVCIQALNMAGVVLTGIVVMFIIPTIVFNIVEGWDILKGVYYCFITLSTIGFGDYVAGELRSQSHHHTSPDR